MRDWCERNGHAVGAEYVEAGASGMDDRRPEFQRMIGEACRSPKPFDAIIVHSLSRFFRDHYGFVSYERRLTRAGVKLLSITQPTGEEASGEMVPQVISLFDEYQSKENGKHTLRAMKENARQGYFNGSRPPFGYRTEAVEAPGRKGKKRRVVIHEGEAAIVRKVFGLYLRGENGHELGDYGIARALNRMGTPYRGKPWTKGRVETALTHRAYIGEWVFNKRNRKAGRMNPPGDWVVCAVPPIIPEGTFVDVQQKRESRQPKRVPPRVVSSPTFLAGLVKCGECGAGLPEREHSHGEPGCGGAGGLR
jgi:DNA invertase Pin-like site-specific DNA recombinase